ncbi:PAS domain-containing sensor histidine kinase [Pelobium manganitolerans]|uniref:PAS domain-containing sensor histidine kinase n=1 Tax=Pelobium manganitolerans TaxID=1842495 RepID=UPI003FA38E8C
MGESLPNALTDEDKMLRQFFDFTPDLFCVASFEGKFLKVNPAVSNVLGYTEEELLQIRILDLIAEEDKEITSTSRDGIKEGKPLTNFENRYITKSGEIVWLSWTSVPVHEHKYIFAIAKDVTERKKSEAEQQLLYQEIDRANKDLEHFARMASHNLRSPIANIMGLFDLIDYDKLTDEDNANVVRLIKQSTEKVSDTLETYINSLIRKDGTSKLLLKELSLAECLNNVKQSLNSLIAQSEALIKTDFNAFNSVTFNKSYLESVLLNLLTNALKYRKPRQQAEVLFSTQINNGKKQLIVADKGLGFDMEKAKGRIFGLNQTFHTNHDAKGVGLFLVKKHITELGGDISVDSTKDVGTRFTITFP